MRSRLEEMSPTRRMVLKSSLAFGVAGLLAPGLAEAQPLPKKGGRLRVGVTGHGASESLEAHALYSMTSTIYCFAMFEPLIMRSRTGGTDMVLAESLEPIDPSAGRWLLKLRKGVVWHDGSPLTTRDVLWSIRRIKDPKVGALNASGYADIDLTQTRAVSDLEIEIGLSRPQATLPSMMSDGLIIKEGVSTFEAPVGTGPFKLESFSPGQRAVFVRNENYWRPGQPYLDGLEFHSFSDSVAKLNAFQAGQLDVIENLDLSLARSLVGDSDLAKSGVIGDGPFRVVNGAASQVTPACMNAKLAPFKDVRVRQAMKYAMDRDLAIKQALQGFGVKANDAFGLGYEDYSNDFPQYEYDPERSRALLQAAGAEGLEVEMMTAPIGLGALELPLTFKRSAKAAGVTINIRQVPADGYYTNPRGPLFVGNWGNAPFSLTYFMNFARTAPFNETQFDRPDLDKIMIEALGTLDAAKRNEMFAHVQHQIQEHDGHIVWAAGNWVDGITDKVNGIEAGGTYPLGNLGFHTWWLAA